jgi:hypothetical protein
MAASNMIVTLAMNATKYASGLRKAAGDTSRFGKMTTAAFNFAKQAMLGLTLAAIRFIPVLANMGAESRKADIQLRFMLENMQGISAATDATVKRMARYADQVNKATGIDDEQIKTVQRKLLVFKSLRETADDTGGAFDRTTKAAIDLAAGGFGSLETNAVRLGRVLENPTKNLNALSRAGIVFTEQEKKKIVELQESGKLLKAQDIVLQSIENRVLGLAEASATPFEKMNAQFQQIGDSIGEAMLPALEDMNREVSMWLSTPQGRKDVQLVAESFVLAAKGIKEMAGFLIQVRNILEQIKPFTDLLGAIGNMVVNNRFGFITELPRQFGGGGSGGSGRPGSGPFGGTSRDRASAPIINFNAPIDSVSAGREVARVLADYNRANGVR